MLAIGVVLFVLAVVTVAVYAAVRPWTHWGYRHPRGKIWRPLS